MLRHVQSDITHNSSKVVNKKESVHEHDNVPRATPVLERVHFYIVFCCGNLYD